MTTQCMLAPMAGITDLPFRIISRSLGCGFAFTEMISAQALVCRSRNTEKMLSTDPADRPLGVQLLGKDPAPLLRALDMLREHPADLLDINAACPVQKVTSKGEGAALLREPRKLGELLRVVVERSGLPVTVKIRSGWDEDSLTAREIALRAEDAGVSAIFIHGRTRAQGYRGRVDYTVIRQVKSSVLIPVVGSGDTLSAPLIRRMFDETGCDGIVIARGALGNPWIFREAEEYLASGKLVVRPDITEIVGIMLRHLDLNCEFHGEKRGTVLFRKFFGWYVKGITGAKPLKDRAFRSETREQMARTIGELLSPRESAALL